MIFHVVAVRDSAADAYMSPFVAQSRGMAIRSFRDEVQRKAADNMLNQHPSDFELHLLGEFDNSTGLFETAQPSVLIRGKDCVEAVN